MSDVFRHRLALATCAAFPRLTNDDAPLLAALPPLGIHPEPCIWNDPAVDWAGYDAVLVRSTWDYFEHHDAFLAWLDRLDALGVPMLNDSRLLRWNSDKRYLGELATHGVATIPTRYALPGTLRDTLRTFHGEDVVVKPSVSGGAWRTARGRVGAAGFEQAVAQLPDTSAYLVQPFVPQVADEGEWSLLYFDGAYSHAVLKRPAAGDYRVQHEHGGSAVAAEPDAIARAAAERALAGVAALGHAGTAYARVDGVRVGDRFLLMELELIEPALHLASHPGAAARFARQLAERLPALARAGAR